MLAGPTILAFTGEGPCAAPRGDHESTPGPSSTCNGLLGRGWGQPSDGARW
jgi:hypothetical protein